MRRRISTALVAIVVVFSLPATAASLSDAFDQGSSLGASGNAAARSVITGQPPSSIVPHFTNSPPEASYFVGTDVGTRAASRITECAVAGFNDSFSGQPCKAIEFSQRNPTRRPSFTIAPTDPLITRAKIITADPHAIAGNLVGTYSACSVQTVTQPDLFETLTCHRYPTLENITCIKQRLVEVNWAQTCVPGTWFGNFWVNTWGNGEVGARYAGVSINVQCAMSNTIRISLDAICTESPCAGHAEIEIDAAIGVPSPQTLDNFIGRSWYYTDIFNRVDYTGGGCSESQCSFNFCTRYEESGSDCDEERCTDYSINEVRACGTFVFERPRSIATIIERWDNQCATFEARLP